MSNAERAAELVDKGDAVSAARAQVYALLAVAEAIDGLRPPPEPPEPVVPFEQTKEGWSWET